MITISIPTYNRPNKLIEKLQNLESQTYKNFIVNVSDNNSDIDFKIRDIVHKYKKKLRINYFKQEKNIGHINNFLFLLSKSNTKYHIWAADDDHYDRYFLEKLIQEFSKNNCIAVMSSLSLVDNLNEREIIFPKLEEFIVKDMYEIMYGKNQNYFKKMMIYGLIETDFLKKAINYDYTWINERDLLVNLRTFGNFRYLKENLFTKTKENSDSSLQNDKFFSSRLSDRGNSKWLKSMLKTTKNTKFLLLMLLLFLPIFFKRMLKSFKYV